MAYLSLPEAAKRLGVNRFRVWKLVDAGRLPAIKIGKNWLVDDGALALFSSIKRVVGRPKNAAKPNKIKDEKNI